MKDGLKVLASSAVESVNSTANAQQSSGDMFPQSISFQLQITRLGMETLA